MNTTEQDQRRIALEHAIDQNQRAHVEDTLYVGAIRDGKLVSIPYNKLTPDERRAAEVNRDRLYCY